MGYTDPSLIAAFLKRELTDNEALVLSVLIPAIQKWLDNKLGTTYLEVAATTRVYDGDSSILDIDPVTSITAVKSLNDDGTDNETYVATTDWFAEPINETVKTEISKRYGYWPKGSGRIAVTGKFSSYVASEGIPQDIQIAATKIAADLLVMGSDSASNVASESLEGHSITYDNAAAQVDKVASADPTVKSMLELRRELLVG